ncbi:hypothetical protein HXX02_13495 [Microbulbifer elongatus]|uniref:Transposase n=1 Tax=Microbulbifer elongatus TaxID=86173 RepID=A0ABT1P617_9GAMM|nr:hypothetical protein [Microbulbifer elongatus]MCQ3830459.1 hypothetical protein [Microbulbifer elongatus]
MAEILSEQGFDGLASALKVLLNELMLIQREQYLVPLPLSAQRGVEAYVGVCRGDGNR